MHGRLAARAKSCASSELLRPHLRSAVKQMLCRGDSGDVVGQPTGFVDPQQKKRRYATPAYARKLPHKHGLRVAVLVWRFDVCDGVLAIVEIVNRLTLEGHTVILATVGDIANEDAFTLYTRPLVYRTDRRARRGLSRCGCRCDNVLADGNGLAAGYSRPLVIAACDVLRSGLRGLVPSRRRS